jgi:hypothetical protein
VDEIARRLVVLLLHENASAVGQRKGGDVGLLAQPIRSLVSIRRAAR